MSGRVVFTINDQKLRLALKNFVARIGPEPLLRAAGAAMIGSIMQTFRDEGSPAGSWPRLAPSTLKRLAKKGAGHKLLIGTGRLRNSIAQEIDGHTLRMGSNVVYARIHQLGGVAGRGARIPARPYLVFRPEDPGRIAKAMEAVVADAIKQEGLQ
jgi:phage virion morphogenesis protein